MPKRHNMKGGAFSPEDITKLNNMHFDDIQIWQLEQLGVTYDDVINKYDEILDRGSGNTEGLTTTIIYELTFANQNNNNMDVSFDTQGTMHEDELNTSQDSQVSGYTTGDGSIDEDENAFNGGKRKKTIKRRKSKTMKRRKRKTNKGRK